MDQVNLPNRELSEAERQLLSRHIWNINVIQKGKVPEAGMLLLPYPAILGAARAIGHINTDPDPDGVYRRVPLLYEWEGGYLPSLGLAAAVLNLRIDTDTIELKAGEYLALPVSEELLISIPIDEQGRMLIPYTETYMKGPNRYPFHTIIEAKGTDYDKLKNEMNLHFALLAEVSISQKDFGPTSFERLYPLSRYFPHALAERIMREGKTELKPAYKELTMLFSDISGFTKWSSDKSPEDVHDFLSEYLESMAGILFEHGGTVNKFMGDGILSFFGDPYEMTNHTEQCIKAAIAMQEKYAFWRRSGSRL